MANLWFVALGTMLYICIGVEGGRSNNTHSYYYVQPNVGYYGELIVKIGDNCYSATKTQDFCYVPSDLEFDAHDNLFAILEDNNDEYPYKAYVKGIRQGGFELLKGLDDRVGVQGLAYDRHRKKMFFATEDGIYVYVLTLSLRYEMASYAFDGTDITDIDFDKDGKPYIATYKNKKIYTVEEGNVKKPFSRVSNATSFKIDNDGNFYFIVDDYFYVLWADESEPQKISLVPATGYKTIAFDREGNGYLAYNEGLLFLKYGTKEFVKVGDLYGAVTSIAIDSKGNLVLGYRKKLLEFRKINNE